MSDSPSAMPVAAAATADEIGIPYGWTRKSRPWPLGPSLHRRHVLVDEQVAHGLPVVLANLRRRLRRARTSARRCPGGRRRRARAGAASGRSRVGPRTRSRNSHVHFCAEPSSRESSKTAPRPIRSRLACTASVRMCSSQKSAWMLHAAAAPVVDDVVRLGGGVPAALGDQSRCGLLEVDDHPGVAVAGGERVVEPAVDHLVGDVDHGVRVEQHLSRRRWCRRRRRTGRRACLMPRRRAPRCRTVSSVAWTFATVGDDRSAHVGETVADDRDGDLARRSRRNRP